MSFIANLIKNEKKIKIVKNLILFKNIIISRDPTNESQYYISTLAIKNLSSFQQIFIRNLLENNILKIEAYVYHNNNLIDGLTQLIDIQDSIKIVKKRLSITLNHENEQWKGINLGEMPNIKIKLYFTIQDNTIKEIEYIPIFTTMHDVNCFQLKIGNNLITYQQAKYIIYYNVANPEISITNLNDANNAIDYEFNITFQNQEHNNLHNYILENLVFGINNIKIQVIAYGDIVHTYNIDLYRIPNDYIEIAVDMGTSGIVINYRVAGVMDPITLEFGQQEEGLFDNDRRILSALGIIDLGIPLNSIQGYLHEKLETNINYITNLLNQVGHENLRTDIANLRIQYQNCFNIDAWNEDVPENITDYIMEFTQYINNNTNWPDRFNNLIQYLQNFDNIQLEMITETIQNNSEYLTSEVNNYITQIQNNIFSFLEKWSDLNMIADNNKILIPAIKLIIGQDNYQNINVNQIIEIYARALINKMNAMFHGVERYKKFIITVPKTFNQEHINILKEVFLKTPNCFDVEIITEAQAVIANDSKSKRNEYADLCKQEELSSLVKKIKFEMFKRVENILAVDIGAGTIDITLFHSNHSRNDELIKNEILKSISVLGAGDYLDSLLVDAYLKTKLNININEIDNNSHKFILKFFIKMLKEEQFEQCIEIYNILPNNLKLDNNNSVNGEVLRKLREELVSHNSVENLFGNYSKKLFETFLDGMKCYKIDRVILSGRSIKLVEWRNQIIKCLRKEIKGNFWFIKKKIDFSLDLNNSKIITAQGAYEYSKRVKNYIIPPRPIFSLHLIRNDGLTKPTKLFDSNIICKNNKLNITIDAMEENINYNLELDAITENITINEEPIIGNILNNNHLSYNNSNYTFKIGQVPYPISPLSGTTFNEHTKKRLWPYF